MYRILDFIDIASNSLLAILDDDKYSTINTNDDKIYIEGHQGSEFTLRIKNNSYKRILAVISVDGLSSQDDSQRSLQWSDRGPHQG